MGWAVIGLGQIDVDEKYTQEILDLMVGDKKDVIDKLLGNENIDGWFEDVDGNKGIITFKIWGNKVINYSRLEKIQEYCKNKNIDIEISVGQYAESDDNYYYNSIDGED